MRGDRVGELARIVDLAERDQDLGRHLLVQLDVLLELADHGPRQRLELARIGIQLGQQAGVRLEETRIVTEAVDLRPGALPSTSTLTVPSGSFSSCRTLETVPIR